MTAKPHVAVTGASSGIGEATAPAFSAAGHPAVLMARRMRLPYSINRQVDVRDRAALLAIRRKSLDQRTP
jgi:NADP-dependent 3-hydroxy acid dehydrogenase YdfG